MGDYNNGNLEHCRPSTCTVDGNCYCSKKEDGWFDGGFEIASVSRGMYGSYCSKNGKHCQCPDCGYLVFPNVQCQDKRCNDVTDFETTREVELKTGNTCFRMDPDKGIVYTSTQWYFDCYTKYNKCDNSICLHGEVLTQCMRVSPGTCKSCGALSAEHYWTTRGGCGMAPCDVVLPGWYMTSPCGNITDSAKAPCAVHIDNPKAPAFANPVAQFYCPGGALPPVHVPAFGVVNAGFTDFNCQDGYFREGIACKPCPRGSACRYDRSFLCPVNYYTDAPARSVCTRCTPSCAFPLTELPMRCQQGSIQNSRCVTCGACGVWPATGINCVRDLVAFGKLSDRCTPRDLPAPLAECAE